MSNKKENTNDLPSMSQTPTIIMISTPEAKNKNQKKLAVLTSTLLCLFRDSVDQ